MKNNFIPKEIGDKNVLLELWDELSYLIKGGLSELKDKETRQVFIDIFSFAICKLMKEFYK